MASFKIRVEHIVKADSEEEALQTLAKFETSYHDRIKMLIDNTVRMTDVQATRLED